MADEAPKSNRGGARPGAGRKKKAHVSPSKLTELDITAALAAPMPDQVESVTQRHARMAIAALVKTMLYGKSESARVTAANAILDRGYGKPTTDAAGFQQLQLFGAAISTTLASEIRDEARKFAELAVETLKRIADAGESESARNQAAKSIIDRAVGAVAPAKLAEGAAARPLGKKEEAALAADNANRGKFATPSAPRFTPSAVH